MVVSGLLLGHGPTSQHNPNSRSPPVVLSPTPPSPLRPQQHRWVVRRGEASHGTSPVGQSLLRRPPSPAAAALPPRQVVLLLHLTHPLVESRDPSVPPSALCTDIIITCSLLCASIDSSVVQRPANSSQNHLVLCARLD